MKSHNALASKTSRLSSRSLSILPFLSSCESSYILKSQFLLVSSQCHFVLHLSVVPLSSVVRFLLCFPDFQLNRQCFFLLSPCLFSSFVQCVFVMLRGFHCQILDRKVDFKFSKVLNILAVLCTSNVLFLNAS